MKNLESCAFGLMSVVAMFGLQAKAQVPPPAPLPQTVIINRSSQELFVMGNPQGQEVYSTPIQLGFAPPPPGTPPSPPLLPGNASVTITQALMSGYGPILPNGPALPPGADNVPYFEIEFGSTSDLGVLQCILKMQQTAPQYQFTTISGLAIVSWVPATGYPDPRGFMERIFFLSIATCN